MREMLQNVTCPKHKIYVNIYRHDQPFSVDPVNTNEAECGVPKIHLKLLAVVRYVFVVIQNTAPVQMYPCDMYNRPMVKLFS